MDWDLEKYRNSSEPEAHWELKRDFMKSIKHMFPEERVVCLAQVLGNIQFMGCRYPHDTMVQVQELARDVIKEYNHKMGDDRITRTLVSVSSAAKDKVNKTNASVKRSASDITDASSGSLGKKPKFMNFVASTSNDEEPKKNTDGFILPPINPKRSEARMRACDMALDILSEYCYKISLKNKFTSDGAHVDIIDVQDNTTVGKNQEKLGDSNIGHKLLSMMGWSGGGLGKEGAGIAEPITAESIFGKQGLGFKDSQLGAGKVFKQKIEKIIKEYMGTSGSNDLVFTTGFDNEQRAEMHKLARRYGLKSKSFGKGDDRHLTISKKFDPKTLLEELIYNGGETEKYILKPPNNLREEFNRIMQ